MCSIYYKIGVIRLHILHRLCREVRGVFFLVCVCESVFSIHSSIFSKQFILVTVKVDPGLILEAQGMRQKYTLNKTFKHSKQANEPTCMVLRDIRKHKKKSHFEKTKFNSSTTFDYVLIYFYMFALFLYSIYFRIVS